MPSEPVVPEVEPAPPPPVFALMERERRAIAKRFVPSPSDRTCVHCPRRALFLELDLQDALCWSCSVARYRELIEHARAWAWTIQGAP